MTKGVILDTELDENDWDGFSCLTEKFGENLQIVGDDLFVTNKLNFALVGPLRSTGRIQKLLRL